VDTPEKYSAVSIYLNCDESDVRASLTDATSTRLKNLVGRHTVVLLDEAQRVKNIGLTLKLLVDNFPELQVVATGSSALELSGEIMEPLTGRIYEFHLHPFSLAELTATYPVMELKRLLEQRIIFGMYPEIEEKPDEAETLLTALTSSYLYKDVLQYQDIRRPELLEKLLVALALQVGNEVSYTELAGLLGVRKETVAAYIHLLEKAFVIFRLAPFSRNLRNELKRMRKIYFCDTGVRNALIRNFNGLHLRSDVGQLWENFMVSERLKYRNNHGIPANSYYWRTHQQQELDLIEDAHGHISAYEFKWKGGRPHPAGPFLKAYPGSTITMVTSADFEHFTGLD
jgi:predicted AAA+ superfamily ATPase